MECGRAFHCLTEFIPKGSLFKCLDSPSGVKLLNTLVIDWCGFSWPLLKDSVFWKESPFKVVIFSWDCLSGLSCNPVVCSPTWIERNVKLLSFLYCSQSTVFDSVESDPDFVVLWNCNRSVLSFKAEVSQQIMLLKILLKPLRKSLLKTPNMTGLTTQLVYVNNQQMMEVGDYQ